MAKEVHAVIHFIDGSKITMSWPQQAGEDRATIAGNVQKALDQDKIAFEVDGDLFVMPTRNVKYVHITPAPPELPKSVIRQAQVLG